MRGAVVAVYAIHVVARGLRNLIFAEGRVLGVILGDSSLQIFDVNVRNNLALLIGCHIVDFVADVHVPVNAFGRTRGRISEPLVRSRRRDRRGVRDSRSLVAGTAPVGDDRHDPCTEPGNGTVTSTCAPVPASHGTGCGHGCATTTDSRPAGRSR